MFMGVLQFRRQYSWGIWGAFRRTFVCDTIAWAVVAVLIVALWGLGVDAVIPEWLLLSIVAVIGLAVYRWRYGRL
jgi:hypothetical protein